MRFSQRSQRRRAKCVDPSDGLALEPHYLPVRARVRLNPLIQPPPDDGMDRIYLKWNMLFPSAQCRLSTDESQVSWNNGRDLPATNPPVTSMRIVSESFPFMFKITAKDLNVGVTCGDLIDAVADNFSTLSSQSDYELLPPEKQDEVLKAYQHNRSTASDVLRDSLGIGMRRLDFLCKDTMFGGLVEDNALVKRRYGDLLPGSFALRCVREATCVDSGGNGGSTIGVERWAFRRVFLRCLLIFRKFVQCCSSWKQHAEFVRCLHSGVAHSIL